MGQIERSMLCFVATTEKLNAMLKVLVHVLLHCLFYRIFFNFRYKEGLVALIKVTNTEQKAVTKIFENHRSIHLMGPKNTTAMLSTWEVGADSH